MKKVLFVLAFLTQFLWALAQEEGELGVNLFSFPVSPDAAKLGSYGSIPVNLSAGLMNFEVPLYDISSGEYTWPVKLSYNYSGFRLEEGPTVCGLGWMLVGGGVVTREVRGIHDEHPDGYSQGHVQNIINNYVDSYCDITHANVRRIMNGELDSEPDKYNVSVPGINISFKVGLNSEPIYLSKHNHKVELVWDDDYIIEILLTDDKGVKYIFNEKETNETDEDHGMYEDSGLMRYTSSWKLSEVIYPNNMTLRFSYTIDTMYQHGFSASGFLNSQSLECNGSFNDFHGYSWNHTKTIIHQKILTGIRFYGGKIDFITTDKGDSEGYREKVYNRIAVSSDADTLLTYDLIHQNTRNLLTSIIKNNEFYYGFLYNSYSIPDFIRSHTNPPWAQDLWGFYNGAYSNNYAVNVPYTPYNANRNTSFFHTSVGALKRITYPTKGYSEITYEQNQSKEKITDVENEGISFNRHIHFNLKYGEDYPNYDTTENTYYYTFDRDVFAELSHKVVADWGTEITLKLEKISSEDCTVPYMLECSGETYANFAYCVKHTHRNMPQMCPWLTITDTGDEYEPPQTGRTGILYEDDSEGVFLLKKGRYKFEAYIEDIPYDGSALAQIDLKFYQPDQEDDGNPETTQYFNSNIGGIRIAKITDYPTNGNEPPITRYYNYNDSLGFSTGINMNTAIDSYLHGIRYSCWFVTQESYYNYLRRVYPHKTINLLELNSGSAVMYKNVDEYTGLYVRLDSIQQDTTQTPPEGFTPYRNEDGSDIFRDLSPPSEDPVLATNFQINGKKSTSFIKPHGYYRASVNPRAPIPRDKNIGRSIGEDVFKFSTIDSTLKLISTSETTYDTISLYPHTSGVNDSNYPWGVKIGTYVLRLGDEQFEMDSDSLPKYYTFIKYREWMFDYLPNKTESKEIFNDIDTLSSTKEFVYDDYLQLDTARFMDSRGEVTEIALDYPYDFTDSVYLKMVDENVLTPKVSSSTQKNGQLLKTVELEYEHIRPEDSFHDTIELITNSNALFKPKLKMESYGYNSLETKENYKYDLMGNLVEYQKENDIITSQLWFYRSKYPVLIAQNCSLDSLKYVIDSSMTTNLYTVLSSIGDMTTSAQRAEWKTYNEALRSHPGLKNAQIHTYTYDILVGMTSQTDPAGQTTYYEYDENLRLKVVRDQDENITDYYKYRYTDQLDVLPTPEFSVQPGLYTSAQSLVLSSTVSESEIRYTLDGSSPTLNSILYTNSIPIPENTSTTICARVFNSNNESSAVSGGVFTVTGTVATPDLSVSPGIYTDAQVLNISCETDEATLRYTLDGTTPTDTSSVYSGPFTIPSNSSLTVYAKAFKTDWTSSAVAGGVYTVTDTVATPAISVSPGTYTSAQSISLSCTTSGAVIRYTTNGTTPTESSAVYSSPLTVPLNTNMTIHAIAFKSDWANSSQVGGVYNVTGTVATPTTNYAPATYTTARTIHFSCSTSGATIRYTTDGTIPTESSAIYSEGFSLPLDTTATLYAKAFKTDWVTSAQAGGTYVVTGTVATPSFNVSPGTYTSAQSVSISCSTSGATIRYTTDGTTPNLSSAIYSGPISVPEDSNITIKAIAYKTDWTTSAELSGTYTVTGTVATPHLSPSPGYYSSSISINITCATSGATIRYTTNGSTPTSSSPIFTSFINLSPTTTKTIKAKAFKAGWNDSAVASGTYILETLQPPIPE